MECSFKYCSANYAALEGMEAHYAASHLYYEPYKCASAECKSTYPTVLMLLNHLDVCQHARGVTEVSVVLNVQKERQLRAALVSMVQNVGLDEQKPDTSEMSSVCLRSPVFLNYYLSEIPFDRRELRQMLSERGGTVCKDFSELATCSSERVFLIADAHYQTYKYLCALARGVRCLKHTWVHRCAQMDEYLDPYNADVMEEFSLPSGENLETGSLVPCFSSLVECMSGQVLMKPPGDPVEGESQLDVLLTDHTCSESLLLVAGKHCAAAVSSEWLIQAIITGKLPDPKAHFAYSWNYVNGQSNQ